MHFPRPPEKNEALRLDELRSYRILDTAPEDDFNRIVRLASRLFGAPMALISLVDAERQWFKARVGLEATETPRDVAFCAHTILSDKVMTVLDAVRDPRFSDNPLVTGEPFIRFYAGAPIKGSGGSNLGTICILDDQPRAFFSPDDEQVLMCLAALSALRLEFRRTPGDMHGKVGVVESADRARAVLRQGGSRKSLTESVLTSFIGDPR